MVDGYEVKEVRLALEEVERQNIRSHILDKGLRVDNRSAGEIRLITCEIGVLPRTHGSGLFTRGQTQSLAITTFRQ